MSILPHVSALVRSVPWAITAEAFGPILELIELREAGGRYTADEIEARIGGRGREQRPTQRVGAVAVIPIHGAIVPRASLMTDMSGGTSLESLTTALYEALADPKVSSIVLDVNSPGGSTALVPETAARIRAARKHKPIVAAANTIAGSAAFYLAAQATELVATPSGMVGSIGVYWAHQDTTKLEESLGVKTTLVSAGKWKTDGFQELTETARAHMQSIVDELYAQMTADIARGRGVPVATVREGFGEGRVVTASNALRLGMIDRIATIDEAVQRAAGVDIQVGGARAVALSDDEIAAAAAELELGTLAAEQDDAGDDGDELEAVRSLRADIRERTNEAAAMDTLRALAEGMRREESKA